MAKNDGRMECWITFAKQIPLQAFLDWAVLTEGREIASPKKHRRKTSAIEVSYDEIRQFMQSQWGKDLCKLYEIKTAEQFLEMLEEIREGDIQIDASTLHRIIDGKTRQVRGGDLREDEDELEEYYD